MTNPVKFLLVWTSELIRKARWMPRWQPLDCKKNRSKTDHRLSLLKFLSLFSIYVYDTCQYDSSALLKNPCFTSLTSQSSSWILQLTCRTCIFDAYLIGFEFGNSNYVGCESHHCVRSRTTTRHSKMVEMFSGLLFGKLRMDVWKSKGYE